MTAHLVPVAIPTPVFTAFDYRIGEGGAPPPGARVRVPFGRGFKIGVVLGPPRAPDAKRRWRPIDAVLDDAPLLDSELLALCRWASDYYHHPIGECVAQALPSLLRRGAAAERRSEAWIALTDAGRNARSGLSPRAHRQAQLLDALAHGPKPRVDLPAAALGAALARAWVESTTPPVVVGHGPGESTPELTAAQARALAALPAGDRFEVTLLDGVTGSGKTELYLRQAAEVLKHGRQVLVLAPEIGLTPQLAERFVRRFGAGVHTYHSGMTDRERLEAWLAARDGSARIIVGTRSASLLPLPALGLVIVDEEHDGSFKQQDGLRFSARDLAVVRARRRDVPVILGSATPSFESLHNAARGRYQHVRLDRRVHSVHPPSLRIVDLRGAPLEEGLSPPLLSAVGRHLEAGGQALLFINRRGFAPVLLCHGCGWQAPCMRCDARMTLHRARGRMICHHCGAQSPVPSHCGNCGEASLVPVGQGTQRIEDALQVHFPAARVERFDSDRMRQRGQFERLLADIRSGAIQILVGTQMLAKGHDFSGLSLVGIVDMDHALYGSDFRALEQMAQLVTQVSGRAGRAGRPGEVLLQTHEPQHPALQALVRDGYRGASKSLLAARRDAGLPPFGRLALLRAEAPKPDPPRRFLEAVARETPPTSVSVLGPVPAPMERLAGRHRWQLLWRAADRAALQDFLTAVVPTWSRLPTARSVRWSIDVDPYDLF